MDVKARKDCQEAMMAFRRVVFALTSQVKAQSTRMIPRTKARESSKKDKARKKLILNSETPEKVGY